MKLKIILTMTLLTFLGLTTQGAGYLRATNEAITSNSKELNDEDLIKKFNADIADYLVAFNNGNYDHVVDMIYPKLFDIVSREQLMQTFTQLEEMGMQMKMDFKGVESISKVIDFDRERFCRVYYSAVLTIDISGPMLENIDQLKQGLVAAYGEEYLTYDETVHRFTISANKSMIAISKNDTDNWKYIEYNEQQEALLTQLIPSEVLDQMEM